MFWAEKRIHVACPGQSILCTAKPALLRRPHLSIKVSGWFRDSAAGKMHTTSLPLAVPRVSDGMRQKERPRGFARATYRKGPLSRGSGVCFRSLITRRKYARVGRAGMRDMRRRGSQNKPPPMSERGVGLQKRTVSPETPNLAPSAGV